mgnify:CR=1 FL=1
MLLWSYYLIPIQQIVGPRRVFWDKFGRSEIEAPYRTSFPGAWWEDGNPDTTYANLIPVSDVVGTKDIPAFFQKDDESVPDEAKAEIAQAMIKADGLRRTRDQNAGSKDGLMEQMSVINHRGLVGRIIDPSINNSKVPK